jgi:hypothetical protein
MLSSRSRSVV